MMKKERSIFRMILTAMLVVLGTLKSCCFCWHFYFSNMGPQMNQTPWILWKNRWKTGALIWKNVMLANQDLSVLSAKINETTASLTEEGAIDLDTLDDSGEKCHASSECGQL